MNKEELFNKIRTDLESKLPFLEDKPEETSESTLKALWFSALGIPTSAEEALKVALPDLTIQQTDFLYKLVEQRLNNTPLAYLTNRQSFMGIELLADKRALIPRKETEILGKKALEISNDFAKSKEEVAIIDVCCGSGNLGLAIASHNQKAKVCATDLSQEAVELTRDNIAFLNLAQRVSALQGDLFSAYESEEHYGKKDLVVCNPPYISTAKVQKMNTEIAANEPSMAFDGGMFGTKIIQRLIGDAPRFLVKGGWLIFEVGMGQGEFIMKLCNNAELYDQTESLLDGSGNIRAIATRKI
jgi:release factor glutamine methyltransferase